MENWEDGKWGRDGKVGDRRNFNSSNLCLVGVETWKDEKNEFV